MAGCNHINHDHDLADFDTNSSDCKYLNPYTDKNEDDIVVYPDDGAYESQVTQDKLATNDLFKTVLVTFIFAIGLLGNATLVFVVSMAKKKTLRQKMLISVLAITCIIRISVIFFRQIYIITVYNHWEFNVIMCKADAFLENFATAAFPYVLVFLVYDSTKFIGCCSNNKNGRINLDQSKSCLHFIMLISSLISVIALPIVFAIVVTVITTSKSIAAYGEGITVINTTVCSLDVDMFKQYTEFKTYILFHSVVWLIFVPLTIMTIMYTVISIVACFKKCKCMRMAHYESNNQIILEQKKSIAKNWFITIICLTVVYLLCFVPFQVQNVSIFYIDVHLEQLTMIIKTLFYVPPAVIPIVFCTVDSVIRQGYCKYLCCCFLCLSKSNLINRKHLRDNDDLASSHRSHNSICSSTIYAKSNVTTASRTTCTSISIGSASEYDPYGLEEEGAHIVPSSPDISLCSSHDEYSSQVSSSRGRYKGKDKKTKGNDGADSTPILVTSL